VAIETVGPVWDLHCLHLRAGRAPDERNPKIAGTGRRKGVHYVVWKTIPSDVRLWPWCACVAFLGGLGAALEFSSEGFGDQRLDGCSVDGGLDACLVEQVFGDPDARGDEGLVTVRRFAGHVANTRQIMFRGS
jgi:hypothetical protein